MRSFRLHLLAIAMATVAQAQAATSQIQGTVLDSDGKAIPMPKSMCMAGNNLLSLTSKATSA